MYMLMGNGNPKEKNMEIQVGNRVRSFDFADGPDGRALEGERACYVEGTVMDIVEATDGGYDRYRILVDRDVFGGKELDNRVGNEVFPPVNGTPTLFSGDTDFVELIPNGY
jgi:hypothetical protein